jgi:hypothetical protein
VLKTADLPLPFELAVWISLLARPAAGNWSRKARNTSGEATWSWGVTTASIRALFSSWS